MSDVDDLTKYVGKHKYCFSAAGTKMAKYGTLLLFENIIISDFRIRIHLHTIRGNSCIPYVSYANYLWDILT